MYIDSNYKVGLLIKEAMADINSRYKICVEINSDGLTEFTMLQETQTPTKIYVREWVGTYLKHGNEYLVDKCKQEEFTYDMGGLR